MDRVKIGEAAPTGKGMFFPNLAFFRRGALTPLYSSLDLVKSHFYYSGKIHTFTSHLKHIHMSNRNILIVSIEFIIPDEIHSTLNLLKIPIEVQEEALKNAIFLFVQERFLVEEEEEIIQHVVNWEG